MKTLSKIFKDEVEKVFKQDKFGKASVFDGVYTEFLKLFNDDAINKIIF